MRSPPSLLFIWNVHNPLDANLHNVSVDLGFYSKLILLVLTSRPCYSRTQQYDRIVGDSGIGYNTAGESVRSSSAWIQLP